MAVNDLVTGSVLGNEFDIGVIETGLIRLRTDGSITRAVDGTLSSRPRWRSRTSLPGKT